MIHGPDIHKFRSAIWQPDPLFTNPGLCEATEATIFEHVWCKKKTRLTPIYPFNKQHVSMKNHILRFCYVTLICICTLACGNDAGDEGCSASELDQRQQVLTSTQNASIEAQIRHQNDPTAENCIAYRDAYMIYLDAFDRWLLCLDNHTKEQWVPVYEDAFQKLETIPC